MKNLLYFVVATAISALLIPLVKKIGFKYGIYAQENERTIHHGKIVRIGGVAIYLSFAICYFAMIRQDHTFNGLFIGATIIFIEGLIDDIIDIKPKYKILGQFLAASAAIFIGNIALSSIHLFFGINIQIPAIGYIITYFWMIGIMNAINLIDGLDGLAGGFSMIVLLTISILCNVSGSYFLIPICLVLAGACLGFLFYNFHPASIFMGDCGSQLLGYMISAVSLVGFRKATFITLGIPVILLFIPVADVFLAIIRRKLKGQSITAPDKGHLHHVLMENLRFGQKGAVITIYIVTALFGLTAYVCMKDTLLGLLMLVVLIILFDLFIEYTGMVSNKYRPILNLLDKFKIPYQKKDENEH